MDIIWRDGRFYHRAICHGMVDQLMVYACLPANESLFMVRYVA